MMKRQGQALAPRTSWQLSDLLAGFAPMGEGKDLRISGLALDSRLIQPGWLFVACRGDAQHGLDFAAEAKRRGAVAVIGEPDDQWDEAAMSDLSASLGLPVITMPALRGRASLLADRFYGEPSHHLQVMGVAGTNGKTSVTHFIAQALTTEMRCGVIGTLGMGFPDDLEPGIYTTPDPILLQSTLARLREQGAGAVAMEVSSHALVQDRTAGVRFSHAIFTNLTRDHLDYHGDMVTYGRAKRRLFQSPGLVWAILNLNDPLSGTILGDLATSVRVGGYTADASIKIPAACELWVRLIQITPLPDGMKLLIDTSLGQAILELGLIGHFNAANVMAVLLVLVSRGMGLSQACGALNKIRGVPGRMERFGGAGAPIVVVDYAHTPDALEQALVNLRPHAKRRLICVFGCGGDRDVGKRPLMGAVAENLADLVILTDDNPRSENGHAIIDQILSGMNQPRHALVERRRGLAIRHAIAIAHRDDLVLVAGKGHETTQNLGDHKLHFSDRAQVQQALAERIRSPSLEALA